jgi:S-(hydroxymethyl)mycothiol dehydrogenase
VVAGARIAGAARIIAVDVAPLKLEWAKQFGATDTVDASADGTDAVTAVRDLTEGRGADFAFEATGRPEPVEQALKMLAFDGTATMVGVQGEGAKASIDLGDPSIGAFENKISLRVSHGGDSLPKWDFPLLARHYLEGRLDLDAMITKRIGLEDIEAAFDDMRAGTVIRSVVVFPEA